MMLAACLALSLGDGCKAPPREAAVPLDVRGGGRPLPDGRIRFFTGVVIGEAAYPFGDKSVGEVGGLPQDQRWPMVWRFEKKRVEIVDDKGRAYSPGGSWGFARLIPGGKFLDFYLKPEPDAAKLFLDMDLIVNDRRFIVKEEFMKKPEGRWINPRYDSLPPDRLRDREKVYRKPKSLEHRQPERGK